MSEEPKTVYDAWGYFRQMVVPVAVSDNELDNAKNCFYAGATSMAAMMDVKPGESIETQAARIALLLEETQAFLDQMVTQGRVQ